MSTDQRASERIGELIHDAFESLLQVNTNLERLQDLIGLGMDLGRLLAPHSQATWKFMVPQEQRFRENWNKFISATEGAESSVSRPQQAAVENVEPAPAPSPPVITAQETAEEVLPETQSKLQDVSEHKPDSLSQGPAPPTPTAPTPVLVTIKEEPKHVSPVGSVENPLEIDDSDDDKVFHRGRVPRRKRSKKVPPSGEKTPEKRLKSMSNRSSGLKNPTSLAANLKTLSVFDKAAGSSKQQSLSGEYTWKPHKDAKVESYGENRKLLHERLDQLGPPLDIDRARITHHKFLITRMDIAAIYGGESVSSFPKIRKEAQAQHPYRNFLHGNFDHNPFMPPEPGWPGLYFRLDEKNDHKDLEGNPIVYRTFARHADKRCVYLGQYTFTKLEDISKKEWRELPDKTKSIWLRFFGTTLHGNRSLARIVLRASLGEEPTEGQIAAKCESIRPPVIRKALAERLRTDISRSFNRGEERIVVWGMKCILYDYDFESNLATQWEALDRQRKQVSVSGDEEDEDDRDEVPTGMSRDHLSRRVKCKKSATQGDSVSVVVFNSVGLSDEDEEDLYYDTDVGDISE